MFINTDLPDVIELRKVSQSYDGGKSWIIKDLDFLIEDKPNVGQFEVILGASGCGKSTLLRYVCGLQKPTAGEVLINGKPRTSADSIPMVFQQYSSFHYLTVLENVIFPLRLKGVAKSEAVERAMEMIKVVGLVGHEKKFCVYPRLSGGQLQRVAIARCLVANPNILMLDEPFGALDTVKRSQMQFMLAGLWERLEATMVLVTHDIAEAVFLADNVWIMDANPGKIVSHVPVGQLLGSHRDRDTKRSPMFTQIVADVEDAMEKIEAGAKARREEQQQK